MPEVHARFSPSSAEHLIHCQPSSELENPAVLKIPPFTKYGRPAKIVSLFTETTYADSVEKLEKLIYMAG